MIKPTVSYVRGLRAVLELDKTKRKEYATRQATRGDVFDNLCYIGVFLFGTGFLNAIIHCNPGNPGAYLTNTSYGILTLTSMILGVGLLNFVGLFGTGRAYEEREMKRAGRAHQAFMRDETPIPKGLEKECFYK